MTTKPELLTYLEKKGFSNKILKAFEKIKRENFIPKNLKPYAYEDTPLSIGNGATISQPYTIAFMLNLLELNKLTDKSININNLKISKSDISKINNKAKKRRERSLEDNKLKVNNINKPKILEIGSGSGYVLDLINEISKNSKIYGVERIKELVEKSSNVLKAKKNIVVICGDGSKGLKKYAPYDRILISASAEKIPLHLYSQLKNDGTMVCPVKNSIFQIKRRELKLEKKEFHGFIFVPLIKG